MVLENRYLLFNDYFLLTQKIDNFFICLDLTKLILLKFTMVRDLFNGYDYEKNYSYYSSSPCNHFSKLMYLVITKTSYDQIKKYIQINSEEINNQNAHGFTVLMIAVICSNKYGNNLVKLLLKNGADANKGNRYGSTALMMAARHSNTYSNLGTVKLLLENNADINQTDNSLLTALMLASKYSSTDSSIETVKLLLENGADVNKINIYSETALILAAYYTRLYNHTSIIVVVELLLKYDADPDKIDNRGRTFIDYLKGNYKNHCEKIISQKKQTKLLMKQNLATIQINSYELLCRPETIRVVLIGLKQDIDQKSYTELKIKYGQLFDYFGIYDQDSLQQKILENYKYMD